MLTRRALLQRIGALGVALLGGKALAKKSAGPETILRRSANRVPRAEHHRQMAGGLTTNEIREHDSRT